VGDRSKGPDVTVVVPTYGRPAALGRCLQALRRQSIWPALEVIVVHDGPADSAPSSSDVIVVETATRRGPAAARNAGARRATTPFVLFTDDDCVPAPDWAERLAAALSNGAEVVAGRTTSDENAFARASQVIVDGLMAHLDGVGSLVFAPTMNLGCRKGVTEDVPFDDAFGDAAGEDRAWCLEIRARGVAITPAPEAHVDHRPELGLGRFVRQHVRYGRGSLRFRSRYRRPLEPKSFYVDLVRRGFRGGPLVGGLVLVAQAATAAGVARERASSLRR
jgi:glycosyltransferase involved in cell wall biosynthesis